MPEYDQGSYLLGQSPVFPNGSGDGVPPLVRGWDGNGNGRGYGEAWGGSPNDRWTPVRHAYEEKWLRNDMY